MLNPKIIKVLESQKFHLIFIVLAGLILYFPSLNANFIGDNINQISTINENFFSQSYGYFRPIYGFTLWLDRLIWNTNPLGFHLTNLIIHLCCTILVYLLSEFLIKKKLFQFSAALFFLLHPIHSMSLFWISGRTDMVCALFFLLSLYYFLKFFNEKRRMQYLLVLLFFIFSLLTKEMALSLPVIIFMYIFIFYDSNIKNRIIKGVKTTVPLFIIILLYFGIRTIFLPGQEVSNSVHTKIALPHLIKNFAAFAGLLVIPGGHIEIANFLKANPIAFLILAILSFSAGLFLFWKFRKSKMILFLLIFTALSISPVIRLVMRWYLYIPSIGFCILLSYFIMQLTENLSVKKLLRSISIISISLIFLLFILSEQKKWVENGATANKICHEIKNKLMEKNISEVIFLNSISEIKETPVLIFGLESFVNFAANNSWNNLNMFKIHVLADVSLMNAQAFNCVSVTQVDSNSYKLTIDDSHSVFDFPLEFDIISQVKQLSNKYEIENKFGKIFINEINDQRKAKSITILLNKDNDLPVMYYSEGKLNLEMYHE